MGKMLICELWKAQGKERLVQGWQCGDCDSQEDSVTSRLFGISVLRREEGKKESGRTAHLATAPFKVPASTRSRAKEREGKGDALLGKPKE